MRDSKGEGQADEQRDAPEVEVDPLRMHLLEQPPEGGFPPWRNLGSLPMSQQRLSQRRLAQGRRKPERVNVGDEHARAEAEQKAEGDKERRAARVWVEEEEAVG